jgi:hypothetical protein
MPPRSKTPFGGMAVKYSIYSDIPGPPEDEIPSETEAVVPPVFTILTLNVAVVEAGTVYTTVFVLADGLDCPRIPDAMISP